VSASDEVGVCVPVMRVCLCVPVMRVCL